MYNIGVSFVPERIELSPLSDNSLDVSFDLAQCTWRGCDLFSCDSVCVSLTVLMVAFEPAAGRPLQISDDLAFEFGISVYPIAIPNTDTDFS